MFSITAETCRRFSLAEILVVAVVKVEPIRQDSAPAARQTWAVERCTRPESWCGSEQLAPQE
jgi:hypothetical protein